MSKWAVVLVSWTAVVGASLYSVERSSNAIDYVAVAAGGGLQFEDSLPTYDTAYYYRVRAYRPTEWSPYSNIRLALIVRAGTGPHTDYTKWCGWVRADSVLVCILLPPANWDCVVVDTEVSCTCTYDYNQDGWIDLSDFARFGQGYHQLPDLVRFASVFHGPGVYRVEVRNYD